MTLLERKMSRTTDHLIDNLNKGISKDAVSEKIKLEEKIRIFQEEFPENMDIGLKVSELIHDTTKRTNDTIEKLAQSIQHKRISNF